MTVKELFSLYKKDCIYDVKIDLVDEKMNAYETFSEVPTDVLDKEVINFSVDGCIFRIETKDYTSFEPCYIGKNTEKQFISKIKGMNPKEIIKFMKEFFDNCVVDCKSQDIKSYASYLYCKENKLV